MKGGHELCFWVPGTGGQWISQEGGKLNKGERTKIVGGKDNSRGCEHQTIKEGNQTEKK